MLTRKDYIAIAAILHREHEKLDDGVQCDPRTTLNIIANKLAGYFADNNSAFDRDRFGRAISTI